MNVFTSMKRAIFNISGFQRFNGDAPWESETIPRYKRDIMRWSHMFTNVENTSTETIIEALRNIGHICYVGGQDAMVSASTLLPHMFAIFKDKEVQPEIRIQVMRTLSQLCHKNKQAQDFVRRDKKALCMFITTIEDVTNVKECRWCCYLLLMLIVDNYNFMAELKELAGLEEALRYAADFPRSWRAWGVNLAFLILQLLGLMDAHKKTPIR